MIKISVKINRGNDSSYKYVLFIELWKDLHLVMSEFRLM